MAILIDQLTLGELKILSLDSDPRTGGGYAATIGSFASINNAGSPVGELYVKVGATNTDWQQIATGEVNGYINGGVIRRLALYPATGNAVDDELIENAQIVTVDIVAQGSRTTAINYQIPNPGNAVTAASFVLTEGTQTINGDKTFGNNVIVSGNLTVNGTLTTVNTVDLVVTDKLITLNKNGIADSGNGAGIEIEENSLIVAYIKTETTTPTSDAWLIKAPDSFELTLDLSLMLANRIQQVQDRAGVLALQTSTVLTVGSVVFVDSNLRLHQDNANFYWDDSNNRLGLLTASPLDTLHVGGNVRVSGSGSIFRLLADSDFRVEQFTVNTTDATVTTLATIAIPTDSSVTIEARVTGRRTGGAGGTAGDAASYVRTARYKNVAGTVTIYNVQSDYTSEDQAGWNCELDVNTTNARIRVTGAASNNVTWETTVLRTIVD